MLTFVVQGLILTDTEADFIGTVLNFGLLLTEMRLFYYK
jgi:hypothetical protein